MGWVKNLYKKIDEKVGGVLPNGYVKPTTPAPSSPTQSNPPTSTTVSPTRSTTSPTTTTPKTTTTRTGGSSGSTQAYYYDIDTGDVFTRTEGSGEAPKPLDKNTTLVRRSSTSGGNVVVAENGKISEGATITNNVYRQPEVNQNIATGATGGLQPRYKETVGGALVNVASNLNPFSSANTYGLIGTQGGGTFLKETFYSPFEYVGDPNKKIGSTTDIDLWRRSKEAGYYVREDTTNPYIDATEYDIIKGQTEKAYLDFGVEYKGEPARILPLRLYESVAKEKENIYEGMLTRQEQFIFNQYQDKVNSGAIDVKTAQSMYETDLTNLQIDVNTSYQRDVKATYESKGGNVYTRVADIEQFRVKALEPPAYKYITNAGRIAETGAVIGAGGLGSGGAIAVSTYLGARTFNETIEYKSNFSKMTTSQKIIGASALTIGVVATGATLKSGVSQFYNEWRGIRYNDLANSPARITGKEVLKTTDYVKINTLSARSTAEGKSLTIATTDVYSTGSNRVGYFTKGTTITKIFDPETSKFIVTSKGFSLGGRVTNVQQVGKNSLSFPNKKVYVFDDKNIIAGEGRGALTVNGKASFKKIKFTPLSQDKGAYYNIAGGKPTRLTKDVVNIATSREASKGYPIAKINYQASINRGSYTTSQIKDYGRITKLSEGDVQTFRIGAVEQPYKTEAMLMQSQQVSQLSASISASTGGEAQKLIINSLSRSSGGSNVGVIKTTTGRSYQIQDEITQSKPKVDYSNLGTSIQILQQKPSMPAVNISPPILYPTTRTRESGGLALSQVTTQMEALISKQDIRNVPRNMGRINPITLAPSFASDFIPISSSNKLVGGYFDLGNFSNSSLPSNIMRGGKSPVMFTPSFSALVFKIYGKSSGGSNYKTGINFRAIPLNFSFSRSKTNILKRFF